MKISSKIVFCLLLSTKMYGMIEEEAYKFMGFSTLASPSIESIGRRFKELSLKMHPDKAFEQNHPTTIYVSDKQINKAILNCDDNRLNKAILTIAILINYQIQDPIPEKIAEYGKQLLKMLSTCKSTDSILKKEITILIKHFFKTMFDSIISNDTYNNFMIMLKKQSQEYSSEQKKAVKINETSLDEKFWQKHPASLYVNNTDKELDTAIEQENDQWLKKTILAIAVLINHSPVGLVPDAITKYNRQLLKIMSYYKQWGDLILKKQKTITLNKFFKSEFDYITTQDKKKEKYNKFLNTLKEEAKSYNEKETEIRFEAQDNFKKLKEARDILIKKLTLDDDSENDTEISEVGDGSGTSLVKKNYLETQLYQNPDKFLKRFNVNNIKCEKNFSSGRGWYLPQKKEDMNSLDFIPKINLDTSDLK